MRDLPGTQPLIKEEVLSVHLLQLIRIVSAPIILSSLLSLSLQAQTISEPEATSEEQKTTDQPKQEYLEKGPIQYDHPRPFSVEGGAMAIDPNIDEQDSSMPSGKRSEFAVAPIPIVNPTIGNGGGGAAIFLFRLDPGDTKSPPASTMGGGFYTSSKSWGLGGIQKFFLFEDRVRIMAGGAYAVFNYDYYGIGNDSGSEKVSIPLHQEGSGFIVEGLYRVWERFFVGPNYRLIKTETQLNIDWDELPIPLPPPKALNADIAAIGFRIQRDSRDSQYYPLEGSLLDFKANFFDESFGGDYNYQQVKIGFNKYVALSPRQVLAMRFSSCHTGGDAPFFGDCALGNSEDIRGYPAGRYRDRHFLATQAEYRLQLPWRFGLVGFGGLGEVAESFGKFNAKNIRPSAGGGVRFMLASENKINLRFDFAVGEDSTAWYVGLMEAF